MMKEELRKMYLKKRMELPEAEHARLDELICANFFSSVSLKGIEVLHTFLPIEKNREVNTWNIINRIRKEHPEIKISIPKINNQSAELEHYYFEGMDQLEVNTWEIPEPVKGVPTPIESIDVVLVPLLAFDRRGHRIGYGRGFYDRFLAGCRQDCFKIGLSHFESEEKIEGVNSTDIPLNMIITPKLAVVI